MLQKLWGFISTYDITVMLNKVWWMLLLGLSGYVLWERHTELLAQDPVLFDKGLMIFFVGLLVLPLVKDVGIGDFKLSSSLNETKQELKEVKEAVDKITMLQNSSQTVNVGIGYQDTTISKTVPANEASTIIDNFDNLIKSRGGIQNNN